MPLAGLVSSLKHSKPGSAAHGSSRSDCHRPSSARNYEPAPTRQRPGRRHLHLSGQIGVGNAVVGGLRRGVGRAPVFIQQFDRHRRQRTEIVLGDAHIEVEFAAVGPIADIAIEAPDRPFRKIAIAIVAHAFERAIYRPIAYLLAGLRRALDAPEDPPMMLVSAP